MAAIRSGTEIVDATGIPLAHGGTVDYADESLLEGKTGNNFLKKVEKNPKNQKDFSHPLSNNRVMKT